MSINQKLEALYTYLLNGDETGLGAESPSFKALLSELENYAGVHSIKLNRNTATDQIIEAINNDDDYLMFIEIFEDNLFMED